MPSFDEHIRQAHRNLSFLKNINHQIDDCWDWQVTVCFYVGVHLMNAHLAQLANFHYRRHEDVENALNPFRQLSVTKVPEDVFIAFRKLRGLSRRSRYLVHDSKITDGATGHFTFDKHFARSVKAMDVLLQFMNQKHQAQFDVYEIQCLELKGAVTSYFRVTSL